VANFRPSGISCQFVAILCPSWSSWIFILVALAASIAANALLQKGPWGHGYRGAGSVLEGKISTYTGFQSYYLFCSSCKHFLLYVFLKYLTMPHSQISTIYLQTELSYSVGNYDIL